MGQSALQSVNLPAHLENITDSIFVHDSIEYCCPPATPSVRVP